MKSQKLFLFCQVFRGENMNRNFAEALKNLRTAKRMTQQELAEKIFVNRSVIARWENAYNLPDIFMIDRICKVLDANRNDLIRTLITEETKLNVIVLDDRKIVVQGEVSVIEKVLPDANIFGFTKVSEAVEFATKNKVEIVFLDIEIGTVNGLDLSKKFLELNPRTNIIFLTAYVKYSFEA